MGLAWLCLISCLALLSFCCQMGAKSHIKINGKACLLCLPKCIQVQIQLFLPEVPWESVLLRTRLLYPCLWPCTCLPASQLWLFFCILCGRLIPSVFGAAVSYGCPQHSDLPAHSTAAENSEKNQISQPAFTCEGAIWSRLLTSGFYSLGLDNTSISCV